MSTQRRLDSSIFYCGNRLNKRVSEYSHYFSLSTQIEKKVLF